MLSELWNQRRARVGVALVTLVGMVALGGPWIAPYSPTEFVTRPFAFASPEALLGGDALGRDVLSRFLWGGRSVLLLSVLATALGVGGGALIGVLSASLRGVTDAIIMRAVDVLLAFPQVVLVLLAVVWGGSQTWLLVAVIALAHAPRTLRVVRGAALQVAAQDFVQASLAIGERRSRIVMSEILPNVTGPLLVEAGLRLTYSIGLIASVSFLGFGLQPPAADWGLMINENRLGIAVQPWPVVAPAAAIALLTIGTNLVTDALARVSAGIQGVVSGKGSSQTTLPVDPPPRFRPLSLSGDSAAKVSHLTVQLVDRGVPVVTDLTMELPAGQIVALVGESGSGKTTVANAVLGHSRKGLTITSGSVDVVGQNILGLSDRDLSKVLGSRIGYIPQDAGESLNPAVRVGRQIMEVLEAHRADLTNASKRRRLSQTLHAVALPDDRAFLRRYPHQLSGGQQQRVLIAMAFVCRPSVVVCDEPTTGLDVVTRRVVLDTVHEMSKRQNVAVLFVSHDLGVVARIADTIAVMYAGRIVELGPSQRLLEAPRHPYTSALLAAVPRLHDTRIPDGIPGMMPRPGDRPPGCSYSSRCPHARPRCEVGTPEALAVDSGHVVRCVRFREIGALPARPGPRRQTIRQIAKSVLLEASNLTAYHRQQRVIEDIALTLGAGSALAVVGESGAGKTTLAKCLAGLHSDFEGSIKLYDTDLHPSARYRTPLQRRAIQYVFQNPFLSLNPRRTIRNILLQPLHVLAADAMSAWEHRLAEVLDRVGLTTDVSGMRPSELSGGERQRVAIARALIVEPKLLVCDEITSALDVSVQASLLKLLAEIKDEMGLSVLFITHDLTVVRAVADDVMVLQNGSIREKGSVESVFLNPDAAYTKVLIDHAGT